MSGNTESIEIKVIPSIDRVAASDWNRCAGSENPFVRHAFLKALEDSGCVGREAGWLPHHLVVSDPAGGTLGCAPLYLKGHSYGEYVFDHGWAAAYERAGGAYYPKLQSSIPFTPVTGPRLLIAPQKPALGSLSSEGVADLLVDAMAEICRRETLSSAHVTFPTEAEWERFGRRGWLQRVGQQYHWFNDGYSDFEDFLGALASRKRKQIRRERRQVADAGITMHTLTGADLRPKHWDAFYRFYEDTGSRKWGIPYLNREFFGLLGETMADAVVLVLAEQDSRFVAGALNLLGEDTLYGRNWGCDEHVRFLHFEACYYQAMDFAIARGLKRVEAGAQGEHKLQRGYVPVRTYSAHYIAHSGLRTAIADFLDHETAHVTEDIEELATLTPFRKGP